MKVWLARVVFGFVLFVGFLVLFTSLVTGLVMMALGGWALWRWGRRPTSAVAAPDAAPPPAGAPEPVAAAPRRRRMSGVAKIAALGWALIAVVAVALIAQAAGDDDEETSAGATTTVETAPRATQPPKPAPVDTGRMSDSEFDLFRNAHAELVDESSQYADEVQRCSVIGTSGDLAGFSDCMEDAYSGFEEDALTVRAVAEETLDDVAKQCRAALNSYVIVLGDYTATVTTSYTVGRQLQFDLFGPAFNELPKASRRYGRFSTNALAACEPR